MHPSIARKLWMLLEPIHAVVHFTPEAKQIYADVGLKGGWMGYFASRSAPMGPVPPEVVVATFYNFAPAMVRRAIPDAWRYATPERVLEARLAVADGAVRGVLGDAAGAPDVARAADLALAAARGADPGGRPLFAGHLSLAAPDAPHLRLWHAATCLREHRGDGHVMSLVVEGVDGCEAHVLMAAQGMVDAGSQRERRGWTEEEWTDAEDRLRKRRMLTEDGELTELGHALRAEVEDRTDALAVAPFQAIGEERLEELEQLLADIAPRFADGLPYPNAIGLPAPPMLEHDPGSSGSAAPAP